MSVYYKRFQRSASETRFSVVLSIVIVTVVIYYASALIWKLYLDPLKHVPGPVATRFTRLWELYQVRQRRFEQTNYDLHQQYGPIVRLGPNKYSLSDPAVVKKVYGHGSKFVKSPFYHAFGNPDAAQADLFSERDITRHAIKRRRVANLFSLTTLLSYEEFVDRCTSVFCEKLSTGTESIDVPTWLQFYAFDVIGEITVGRSFGYLERGEDHNGIIHAIHETMTYGSRIGIVPELHSIMGSLASRLHLPIPFQIVQDWIDSHRQAREAGTQTSDRRDFLSKLLGLRLEDRITDLDLMTTMGANIAAGSDTTSITLSTIVYYLAKNPKISAKLRSEITTAEQDGHISDPITFQQAQKLPYLQAIIKEALRIHPATGQPMMRVVPPGGAELGGQFFPAGTQVGVNPWVIHFDNSIFGDDTRTFDPERWMRNDKTQVIAMDANLLTFGTGARTCIGKNISLLEMSKVIPQLYRKFDFQLEDHDQEWELDNVWFVKQKFRCSVVDLAKEINRPKTR